MSRDTSKAYGEDQLPYVVVNMAMTADGKIATANRKVTSFGSQRDQEHLLEVRSTADAIMCGAHTLEHEAITLGPGPARYRRLRIRRGLTEYNLRVVVSGKGSINPRSAIFQSHFSPIILLTTERITKTVLKSLETKVDAIKICGRDTIAFASALRWLHDQWQVKRLLCEGGGTLNGALFKAGLINELHLTLCPKIFGGRLAPTIADGEGCVSLATASRMTLLSAKRVGDELYLVYRAP